MGKFNNISRRQFLEASGIVAAGLGLAGCSSSDDSSTSTGSASASSSTSSSDTIKVGILGPFTGDVANYGTACRNGALLYISQVNEAGGINGKQIETNEQDEKGDATEAVNAYNLLVEDGVSAVVGDVTTGPTIAVAQVAAEDNMPCVTPSATNADVISYGSNYFRACVTDPFQGLVMANFVAEEGYTVVGTLYNSDGDYETGVNDAFVEQCAEVGVTVTSEQSFPEGSVDFSAQLTTLISENPEVIFAPNYYEVDGQIVTQARELGFTGPIMGVDGWDTVTEYASAEDLENCYYCCSFVSNDESEIVQEFNSAFEAEYGETPGNFDALGYDAAMIVCAGLEAAEAEGLEPATDEYKQAVIDGIAACTVEGVTGTISYDGTGDPVKSTLVCTIKDGVVEAYTKVEA